MNSESIPPAGRQPLNEKSAAILKAILQNADHSSWHKDAPKIKSSWDPFDLYDIRGCNLSGSLLGELSLSECALDGADFTNCSLEKTMFQGSSASRASFANAKLYRTQMTPFFGEYVNFGGAMLQQAFIEYGKLPDSNFTSATLNDVSLSHTDVSRSSFVGAKFKACGLSHGVFTETDLSSAVILSCDLRKVSFQNAILSGALLEGCEMRGTDFRGASLDRTVIRGGEFGLYHEGSKLTPTRFDDTLETRKLVAASGAQGIESIEWHKAGSLQEKSPKRLIAGEACTRSGFWLTPAKSSSRRYFKLGDVMPELGGDYGATIWQWDQNQDPPQL